jgi:hypothetical protein
MGARKTSMDVGKQLMQAMLIYILKLCFSLVTNFVLLLHDWQACMILGCRAVLLCLET